MLSRREWIVTGWTRETALILNQWVAWMVTAGAEHGPCKFDGWGAQAG
jgi:hypothetical protein